MRLLVKKVKIKGTGIYTPKKVVTNFDLEEMVDTSDEWIYERTGIKQRHICSTEGGEWPSDMAYHATMDALKAANMEPNDIDMIILGSVTPDFKLPNTACILQQKLGITNKCAAIDIAAACSGFVYGLNMITGLIKMGAIKNALIVGTEMLSREVNWEDRNSCILFGDGCGVAIVGENTDDDDSDILSMHLGADGSGKEFFDQPIGGSVYPITQKDHDEKTHFMQMKGKEMFKVATRTLAENAKTVLKQADKSLDDVDWLIPHQANVRIIETTGKLLGIAPEKVIINIDKYANTSAATVPIALHEAITDGRIKRGQTLLLDAFGAGLTSGATLLTY